ncbi:MAG TPA: aminopeptidase [Candidatus Faeciplasma pullistercoris]|uniref:Aminopeptidase n=1 Tax=Candidatus Faeciplasma pullistercoris TaxID=2840800 RepID=A0A9D1GWC5_9FIRM|nr:aminopeptidase [Candidatus Faeciplasma pullistercoris]
MNQATISKIVKASGVSAGELVLVHFWGEDTDKEIANSFMKAVAYLGASPVLVQQSRSINRDIFLCAKESCFDDRYFDLFSKFDAILDVFAYQPVVLGYSIKDEQMSLYRRYVSQLFYRLMECKRFTQIRIPTEANATESGLATQEYIRRMNNAYDIDYERLRIACEHKVESFAGVQKVSVYTGENCVAHFDLTDRFWHIDAGNGDLPCGEIYIAPNESQTQGAIFFSTLYLENRKYTDVTLRISNGEICDSNYPVLSKYFSDQPRENRIVCEFGIGMNPNVTSLCGYTVLDEKMAGTFHIAVGANNMFGGKNRASNHIDFVGRGKIEVIV